jgi:peptidoglycan/LPS O-acetylase OafA/YrhL
MDLLLTHPIAAFSSAIVYAALLSLFFARPRAFLIRHLTVDLAKGRAHLGGFDSIRGLAAAYVALSHCWYWTYPVFAPTQITAPMLAYGMKAVPIFAGLSGFLIYLSAKKIQNGDDLKYYAFSRILRIFPVYLASFFIAAALGLAVPLEAETDQVSLFVSEIFMFYVLGFPAYSNPVAWSLYAELTFYALISGLIFSLALLQQNYRTILHLLSNALALELSC